MQRQLQPVQPGLAATGGARGVARWSRRWYGSAVDQLQAKQVGNRRLSGTVLLTAGVLISLLSMMSDSDHMGPHLFAGFLVLTGIGLRIEAAIIDRGSHH